MSYDDNERKTKKRKILILELIVILMLIPSVIVYYEWQIAEKNNAEQMQKHALTTTHTAVTPSNMTTPLDKITNRP